jgi:hypothetical protein
MILLAALLAGAQPALAKAGNCGWVHGRYSVANGSMIHRIWVVGTSRMLNLDIADESNPAALKRFYDSNRFRAFHTDMFADFYVCARERHIPGHMQRVHLSAVKNVRIVKRY